jgi:hypothetical protein
MMLETYKLITTLYTNIPTTKYESKALPGPAKAIALAKESKRLQRTRLHGNKATLTDPALKKIPVPMVPPIAAQSPEKVFSI